MNMRNLLITVGLLITITTTAQQKEETTLDLLKHTIWEHGKPIYGDYRLIYYTDSTVTIQYEFEGKIEKGTWLFYLTDKEEFSFDRSKIGKVKNGTYYMTTNENGFFTSHLIVELTKDKLSVSPIRSMGKFETNGVPWNYTPLKKEK